MDRRYDSSIRNPKVRGFAMRPEPSPTLVLGLHPPLARVDGLRDGDARNLPAYEDAGADSCSGLLADPVPLLIGVCLVGVHWIKGPV